MPEDAEPPGKTGASGLVPKFIGELLSIGGYAYVLGFIVVMAHTSRLNVPAMDAVRLQCILAGWPIAVVTLPVFWLGRIVFRRVIGRSLRGAGYFAVLVTVSLLALPLVYLELRALFLKDVSLTSNVVVAAAIPLMLSGCFYYAALRQRFDLGKDLALLMGLCSFIPLYAVAYAFVVYPNLAQTFGGGRPERVSLFVKAGEAGSALGLRAGEETQSVDVYLYYRTSEYLLVEKAQSSDRRLLHIPAEQVGAIVWSNSHALR